MEQILLVDDNTVIRELVAELLRKHNFTVAEADGVESTKKFFQTHQACLVCSDVNMQDGTGFDLYRYVLLESPKTKFMLFTNDLRVSVCNRADKYGIPLVSKNGSNLIDEITKIISAE